jgi:hypothetical protein
MKQKTLAMMTGSRMLRTYFLQHANVADSAVLPIYCTAKKRECGAIRLIALCPVGASQTAA